MWKEGRGVLTSVYVKRQIESNRNRPGREDCRAQSRRTMTEMNLMDAVALPEDEQIVPRTRASHRRPKVRRLRFSPRNFTATPARPRGRHHFVPCLSTASLPPPPSPRLLRGPTVTCSARRRPTTYEMINASIRLPQIAYVNRPNALSFCPRRRR